MSNLSPGPIGLDEILLRIIVTPIHMHKKRKDEVTASCLSHAETIGLSLLRQKYATNEEVISTATILVEGAKAQFGDKAGVFGVLQIEAASIKRFVPEAEENPCFCLYDTAEPARASHCEAFQKVSQMPDFTQSARRVAFYGTVKQNFVPVGVFRDGLLNHLAPRLAA